LEIAAPGGYSAYFAAIAAVEPAGEKAADIQLARELGLRINMHVNANYAILHRRAHGRIEMAAGTVFH
jgi:hypothetical protein